MLGSILRVLIGFGFACVAAGLTLVLFVTTPVELANTPTDTAMDVLTANGLLALAVATHSAVFAAPFALIGAAIGEWRGIAHWTYYVLVGIAIATLGFLAQHLSEGIGDPTILNNYALAAFLTTGFVGGMVYWLLSGQFASDGQEPQTPEIMKPKADPKAPPRPMPAKS